MSVYKHGNWWWYDFELHGRRHRDRAGRTKTEAQRAEHKARSEAMTSLQSIEAPNKQFIKIEDFADLYLKRRQHLRSRKRDVLSVRTLLKQFRGSLLHTINSEDIEDYKCNRLSTGVSNATINRELAALKKLFNLAIQWKNYGIKHNPVNDVDLLEEPPGRTRYLKIDEIHKLKECCQDYFRPIVIAALHMGMRLKEILDLKWENVYISGVLSPYVEIVMSKNGKKRLIPLDDTMINLLHSLPQKIEYVFLNRRGNSKLNRVSKPFNRAVQQAGIMDFRFHDLRHTFASHFVMNGGDLLSLKEILGHSSLRMVERYSHLSSEHKREKLNNLDRAYSASPHNSPTIDWK
jgi:integrase